MKLAPMLLVWIVVASICVGRRASACLSHQFPCEDGSCVLKSMWCDAEIDCADKSDERYCATSSNLRPHPNKCDEKYFVCTDGPCIPAVGRCDGHRSCYDNSDEEGCPTVDAANGTEVVHIMPFITHDIEDKKIELHPMTTATEEVFAPAYVADDYVHSFQADSDSSQNVETADEGLEQGFVELDSKEFKYDRAEARQWLLKVRDERYGWGRETPRALIALYVSGEDANVDPESEMLMSKQLHLHIFAALTRNGTAPIPLGDLSLFINALSASCDDPRNFYGQDLVKILRHRTDNGQASSMPITPLVYLTLCMNDASTYEDLRKIREMLPKVDKIDTEALVSLASTCLSRNPKLASYSMGQQVANRLYHKVARRGLPRNIYQLALVTQALNEARVNQDKWNRSEALDLIVSQRDAEGSFGDILSTYYAMPVLSGRSLLSVGHQCGDEQNKDSSPVDVLQNGEGERSYVRYSLHLGSPVEVAHTLMMKVKKATNFLDVMRMAGVRNPAFEFKYDTSEGKPAVYSIGGVVNDPERGLFWRLYVTSMQNSTDPKNLSPYEGDIRSFVPTAKDEIVFWMKSIY